MTHLIQQTTDSDVIRALIGHPDIYPDSADDGTPAPYDMEPPIGEGCYWLVPLVEARVAGIFFIHAYNAVTYEFHVGILKGYRGRVGYQLGRTAIEWVRQHTPARKLRAWVETDARHVYAYVTALGFGKEGLSHGSTQRGGVLKDQYLMGMHLCHRRQ